MGPFRGEPWSQVSHASVVFGSWGVGDPDVAVRCGCQMADDVSMCRSRHAQHHHCECIPDPPRTKNAQVAVWSGRTVAVFLEVVRKNTRLSASAGSQRPPWRMVFLFKYWILIPLLKAFLKHVFCSSTTLLDCPAICLMGIHSFQFLYAKKTGNWHEPG